MNEEKIKCYELDFGDTNLISENIQDILGWIETDMQGLDKTTTDQLEYTITLKMLTREEIEALPEWA